HWADQDAHCAEGPPGGATRALPRGGVTGIQRRLGIALFERGDDMRRIADRPAVQEQDWQRAAPRRAPGADQVVGAEHPTAMRDALVVEGPADLLVEMRERDVPQQRRVHGDLSSRSRARRRRWGTTVPAAASAEERNGRDEEPVEAPH